MGDFLQSTAEFSKDRQYRYTLTRVWGEPPNPILWIMLNPSTADEVLFDPTVRRCYGFSKDWGFNEMVVCNLFALRSTDPKALYSCKDPVGPDNAYWIRQMAMRANKVIVAWGNHSFRDEKWAEFLLTVLEHPNLLEEKRNEVYCLGKTKTGNPKHPLYIKASTKPILFKG